MPPPTTTTSWWTVAPSDDNQRSPLAAGSLPLRERLACNNMARACTYRGWLVSVLQYLKVPFIPTDKLAYVYLVNIPNMREYRVEELPEEDQVGSQLPRVPNANAFTIFCCASAPPP